MYYRPENFQLYELYPKDIFEKGMSEPNGEQKLWQMWDDRILYTIQHLRNRFGSMVCNTWYWGGNSQYRGWRPFDCPEGEKFSIHKAWKAVDLISKNFTATDIRSQILADPFHEDFKYITCVEMNVSWLHVDTRNRDKKNYGILNVYPK